LRTVPRKLWVAVSIAALVLGSLVGGIAIVHSAAEMAGAGDDFCGEVDQALACRDSKELCLVAYHHRVTSQLARAKTIMEFRDNPIHLNDLDGIYDDGKQLLSSDLSLKDPADFETQRAALYRDCLASFP
jgi:hypothetical protein